MGLLECPGPGCWAAADKLATALGETLAPPGVAPSQPTSIAYLEEDYRFPGFGGWLVFCAKGPGRSKQTLLHMAGGLSPACPTTTDLPIKVLPTISLCGGNVPRLGRGASLHYQILGSDPVGSAACHAIRRQPSVPLQSNKCDNLVFKPKISLTV